ncbi:GTP-binding subunit of protease [Salmonella bongori]|nr:GTP-binding subunit of protease [Salmonella bongori]
MYAADQLFATLDPTLRRIDVADVGETVLADTVGFIRHLPHDLVAAFKATLQETRQATLLLACGRCGGCSCAGKHRGGKYRS